MIKLWLGAFVMTAIVGGLLLAQVDDTDIFADATISLLAIPTHGHIRAQLGSITSFTSDRLENPQTIFFPGDFIAWTSEFFVVPQGAGLQTESINLQVTTPHKTRTFNASFNICNTSDPNTCDDIPDETSWALVVYLNRPVPQFLNNFLLRHGPIPFSSVVTGSGYQGFVATLTGNSVAPLPQ